MQVASSCHHEKETHSLDPNIQMCRLPQPRQVVSLAQILGGNGYSTSSSTQVDESAVRTYMDGYLQLCETIPFGGKFSIIVNL